MIYLLDTNICLYIIKQKPPEVFQRFAALDRSGHTVGVSVIVAFEFDYGIAKSRFAEQARQAISAFLKTLIIYPFDRSAAQQAGQVWAVLEKQGLSIGPMDTLIAGHALSLQARLVTHNLREFGRVPNLDTENWVI